VFLKVQDGCDYNCSFCTIPMARGRSRSDRIDNIVAKVTSIAIQGVKEIVLTGVNLGDFGRNTPSTPPPFPFGQDVAKTHADVQVPEENFLSLIKALDGVEGIERFRISSIEPNLLGNDIIEFVGNSKKFMPHFHIPLQSGSNRILGLMRRRYKKELYAERVGLIKTLMPHCCIGVDVIVGFPGETEDDFNDTVEFLTGLDISYLHVFTYSERDNTFALELRPVVPMAVRQQRNKILRNLGYRKMQEFTRRHIGETRKVLFESVNRNGMLEGFTDNYIKITVPGKTEWENKVMEWKI
jgi:threonylcarbamoyladenosine tRNA methylthiotransferase MtaB